MAAPARSASRSSVPAPLRRADVPPPSPRPFRDNTRLIVFGIIALLAVLGGLLVLAGASSSLAPDFLTEFVLYALVATDVTMLAALTFVLARNILKLVVEHRRALPFARFRVKLVAVLLGMTLIPALLVLIVGSELIRTSVDRWFNAPMDDVLASATAIAGDYYQERQARAQGEARRVARAPAGRPVCLARDGRETRIRAAERGARRRAVARGRPGAVERARARAGEPQPGHRRRRPLLGPARRTRGIGGCHHGTRALVDAAQRMGGGSPSRRRRGDVRRRGA